MYEDNTDRLLAIKPNSVQIYLTFKHFPCFSLYQDTQVSILTFLKRSENKAIWKNNNIQIRWSYSTSLIKLEILKIKYHGKFDRSHCQQIYFYIFVSKIQLKKTFTSTNDYNQN